jgi:multidrug resistance efflux pump
MRNFLFGIAAATVLPVLALGQNPNTGTYVSSGAMPNVTAPSKNPIIESCSVTPLTKDGEALVPAQEAGVIVGIDVKELDEVKFDEAKKEGAVMVRIDDKMAQKQYANATAEYNAAKQKADSDIDIQVAEAARDTSWFEYQKNLLANQGGADGKGGIVKGVPGAVTQVDIEHSKYQWIHAKLAIDQYKNEKIVNTYTADAKKAEMESAEEAIRRRKVCAPFPGVVEKIMPHIGEWVKPGDTVVRLIRMDHLKVEGYLKVTADYNPGDVMNRPVTVKVVLAKGREESFPGKIVYVDPEVKSLREYMVRAEVDNRQENGQWLLRPGLPAKMEIQLQ